MLNEGDTLSIDLARVTESGRGVAIAEDGHVIIIDGVEDEDESINIEITRVLEKSYFAKKIDSKKKSKLSNNPQINKASGPYELDGEDPEDYDDDDDSPLFDDDDEYDD